METIYEIQRIKQVVSEIKVDKRFIRSPEDAADIAREFIGDEDREVFLVACLNTKNAVVAVHRAHVGSLNASICHPREIFKAAILNNAASIICFHNHPSGSTIQSPEDVEVTKRLYAAGNMIGIEMFDHIIIGGNNSSYISMREKGYF
ncbi:JAB domain-containing protein [Oceanobacillus polygoni]|uniref:DNA repair protein RadC n=1 Tax=Oceanobacillus polygoni TaxID=1235259 RepID=A0A9X0Z285_9BACI|nr:JAB domain-containing protein [Oceanobacillus polygoni]MBP2079964.1 DNA repair protein RadC [Oceanobacillus polygoni]